MTGPSWAAGALAAVMVATAVYCAGRLAVTRLRRRVTELDSDGVHVVMGAAMAGMLVPRLSPLPGAVWAATFGAAGAWFAAQAIRSRGGHAPGRWRCPHPVPHLVESAAMLYMLLAVHRAQPGAAGPAGTMPGMGGSAGSASLPALAAVLALFMAGYVMWTIDRLASLLRAPATGTAPVAYADLATARAGATALAPMSAAGARQASGSPSAAGYRDGLACRPMLAPRLAACYKIAMGVTMGYMLILMS